MQSTTSYTTFPRALSRRIDRLVALRDRVDRRLAELEVQARRTQDIAEFVATAFAPPYQRPHRPDAGTSMENRNVNTLENTTREAALEMAGYEAYVAKRERDAKVDRLIGDVEDARRSGEAHRMYRIGSDIGKAKRMTDGLLTVLSGAFDDERQQIAEAALRFAVRVSASRPAAAPAGVGHPSARRRERSRRRR